MYKAKEPCQGCGLSGKDKPRYSKDDLCHSCSELLRLGRAKQHDDDIDRAWIFQHHHAYRTQELNIHLHALLASISNPHSRGVGPQPIKHESGSNGERYSIPTLFVEPLRELFSWMEEKMLEIQKERKNMPQEVADTIAEERDVIYNKGVEAGRQLLMQLNSGEISMEDFGKKLDYRKHDVIVFDKNK